MAADGAVLAAGDGSGPGTVATGEGKAGWMPGSARGLRTLPSLQSRRDYSKVFCLCFGTEK